MKINYFTDLVQGKEYRGCSIDGIDNCIYIIGSEDLEKVLLHGNGEYKFPEAKDIDGDYYGYVPEALLISSMSNHNLLIDYLLKHNIMYDDQIEPEVCGTCYHCCLEFGKCWCDKIRKDVTFENGETRSCQTECPEDFGRSCNLWEEDE